MSGDQSALCCCMSCQTRIICIYRSKKRKVNWEENSFLHARSWV
uniref:BMA-MDT-9, isoform b n=1 Tax=Brugia malayi TaxID=6279 RepID=A0A1I9GF20_BRUMA|nr:BMA-MDT-9, isoform b [Brugia malayi]